MLNKKRLVMMGSVVMLSISSVGGCGAAPKGVAMGLCGTEVGIEQEDTSGSYNIQAYDEEDGDTVAVNANSGSTDTKGTSKDSKGSVKADSKDTAKSIEEVANDITNGLFSNIVNRGGNSNKKDDSNKNATTVASNSTATDTSSKSDGKSDSNKTDKKEESSGQSSGNSGTTNKSETPKSEGSGSSSNKPSGNTGGNQSGSSVSNPGGSSSNKPSGNSNSGGSGSNSGTNTPVKQECVHDWVADYKTVHHNAVAHVVHHPAGSHTVHHDAVTHTVHHDAEGYWTQRQWVVTQAANPGSQVVVGHCSCGFSSADESVMANHRQSKLLEGDYSHGKAWSEVITQGATPEQGYWKEPEWIQTKAAYDEVVVDKAAWDETVVDSKAWDETVVDKAAYDEKVIYGYHCSKCGKTK